MNSDEQIARKRMALAKQGTNEVASALMFPSTEVGHGANYSFHSRM